MNICHSYHIQYIWPWLSPESCYHYPSLLSDFICQSFLVTADSFSTGLWLNHWISFSENHHPHTTEQVKGKKPLPTLLGCVSLSSLEVFPYKCMRKILLRHRFLSHIFKIFNLENSERCEKNIIICFQNETRLSQHTLLRSIHIILFFFTHSGDIFWSK